MDKVQFQLEATLPELKDLHEKGLFTKNEINEITRRRTTFEMSLIRQVTRKEDFFKYAEYEINLERLRRVRWKRLKFHLNPPPPSASTYSLPRRAVYILKRATVKFPGDLAVWLAYIEYASRERMRKVVTKGLNSALQHHPLSSTIYLLISYNYLHPTSPFPASAIPSSSKLDPPSSSREDAGFSLEGTSPARTTLLLGLRLLPQSRDLWREYIKLELGWVEALRRRWRLLGIEGVDRPANGQFQGDDEELIDGQGSFGPEGEDARKAILSGQLVVHAIGSALQAAVTESGIGLGEELLGMLRTYPSPLRSKALEVVYEALEEVAKKTDKAGARARLFILTKRLYDRPYDPTVKDEGGVVLSGLELVEELGRIGREIRRIAKGTKGSDWADVAGAWLGEQIDSFGRNGDLREYLLSVLTSLTKPAMNPTPGLLLRHLGHLARSPALLGSRFLATARSHAAVYPSHPTLQKVRLKAELEYEPDQTLLRSICQSTIKAVTRPNLSAPDQAEVQAIWSLWVDFEERGHNDTVEMAHKWETILRDSLRFSEGLPGLHPPLLARYFLSTIKTDPRSAVPVLERISARYRPDPSFFKIAFTGLAELSADKSVELEKLYTAWRAVCRSSRDKADAVLAWAGWLMREGRGRDAGLAVDVVRREVREDEAALGELETGWKRLLEDMERSQGESEVEGEEVIGLDMEVDGSGGAIDVGGSLERSPSEATAMDDA